MNKISVLSLLVAGMLLSIQIAYADNMHDMNKTDLRQVSENVADKIHKGHGMVNKINVRASKINISHEAIDSLKWPQMTMDFIVQKKVNLADIKPGIAVDFELSKFENGYQITRIVPSE